MVKLLGRAKRLNEALKLAEDYRQARKFRRSYPSWMVVFVPEKYGKIPENPHLKWMITRRVSPFYGNPHEKMAHL